MAGLFEFGDYDLAGWISDYIDDEAGTYYTQRWYIARRDQGSVSLCDYYPPTDDNSILNGGEWTRFETSDRLHHQPRRQADKEGLRLRDTCQEKLEP